MGDATGPASSDSYRRRTLRISWSLDCDAFEAGKVALALGRLGDAKPKSAPFSGINASRRLKVLE